MTDEPAGRARPGPHGGLRRTLTDPRRVINSSIFVLAFLVCLLAGSAGWSAYRDYREAQRIQTVLRAAEDLIQLSGQHALERGLTALRLGAGPGLSYPSPAELHDLREEVDTAWQRARDLIRGLGGEDRSPGLDSGLKAADKAYARVRKLRRRVDAALRGDGPDVALSSWFRAATGFNEASHRLRKAVVRSVGMPDRISRLQQDLQHHAWLLTEHGGRIRGILAYYIGAGAPVPPATLHRLRSFRGVAERSLSEIHAASGRSIDPRIASAISHLEETYLANLPGTLERAFRAAPQGSYAMDARGWVNRMTQGIDAARGVSAAVSRVVSDRAGEIATSRRRKLGLYLFLLVGASGLAAFSVTRVRRTANAMFQQKMLAEVTIQSIGDGVITTDASGRVDYLNPMAEQMTGWNNAHAIGRTIDEVFPILNATTRDPERSPVDVCLSENRVVGLDNETVLVRADGTEVLIEDSAAPIYDRDESLVGTVLVFYEIAPERQSHQFLAFHATRDPLTQLVNRREFERRLTALVDRTRREGGHHVLAIIDLDRFKLVNDTCGHKAGDQLLRQVSRLLQGRLGCGDTLARLGGDDFGLLLPGRSLEEGRELVEAIRADVLGFRFSWQDQTFAVGASAGLVSLSDSVNDPQELLAQADAACFTAKDAQFQQIQVYSSENTDLARRHSEMQWVPRITAALEADRFHLDCQPIAPIQGDAPCMGEVLIRMQDEAGETVPPLTFLPVAERYDLMGDIDRWVIRRTLATLGQLPGSRIGDPELRCTINLSGASLSDTELCSFIHNQLEEHGVPPGAICFEITETAAVSHFEQAREFIGALRDRGCHFALDDFGSGQSSFTYLNNLPVDFLKIDGYLVSRVAEDPVTESMVQAIHQVGRAMGIKTIAEFVDSEEVVTRLREIGVDYLQGFHIGRPVPFRECLDSCGDGSAPPCVRAS